MTMGDEIPSAVASVPLPQAAFTLAGKQRGGE